jgi:hypothetical protein
MNRNEYRLLWFLRLLGPCSAQTLEGCLWRAYSIKDSTVRGIRKRLERRGLIVCAGRYRDGRKKWSLAP